MENDKHSHFEDEFSQILTARLDSPDNQSLARSMDFTLPQPLYDSSYPVTTSYSTTDVLTAGALTTGTLTDTLATTTNFALNSPVLEQSALESWYGNQRLGGSLGGPTQMASAVPAPGSEDALNEYAASTPAVKHFVFGKDPFQCHCGVEFTSLFALERHIQHNQENLIPKYPCTDCTSHQGKNGFKRKERLVKHLRRIHGYSDDKLYKKFPRQRPHQLAVPICHFEDCEYYREPEFRDRAITDQKNKYSVVPSKLSLKWKALLLIVNFAILI
ncbi:hypothetical protein F5Y10DRAFT_273971 [Nemania abortiva]|nr:hypothetical protein F5Y10DRAFT_273971 [Nemania abortiva]